MPAQSKQQQKFMGLVRAIQKGDVPASDASPEAQKVAKDMKPSDVKDFASTSHKGLPKKVKQEIVKKLKEYAMTLPNHHAKPAAPMDSLRSDDEMDIQETRIPQNFNVGTTRDYHTKLATTPRKKYDKTNFNPAHSGQEDLEEAQAVSGGKVHKFITGKNLKFKGKSYSQIEFETLGVDNKNQTIRLKIIAPKEIFGNEMSLDFRTIRRGPFFKTDTSKVNEASPCWDGYKQVGMKNKGGKQVPNCVKESVNESSKADIIKDLDKAKNDLLKKVDVLIAKKKKLYSNIDIESPMTADEKKLDKDVADLFSQINKLVLQKRSLKEYGQALDLHFILNKDAKLDGTPEPKKAIGEELSLDEKEMVIGIIEILKQVEDPKNRMRIALNMLKKFKEEDIEFDYRKFIDHLKEYSMGSYEYDKGNRELGEAMIKSMKNVVTSLLPTNTLARHANDPNKNKEFVEKIVKELGALLNRFYKQNDINLVLK